MCKQLLGGVLALCTAATCLTGCLSIRTKNEIEPIHITLDINLRVQKDLDTFFSDLDEKPPAQAPAPEKEKGEKR